MPHTAVDPVVLASSIVLRLQTVFSREVEPGTFAVLTVGALTAGSKANIIPASAELLLNIRTYDLAVREQVIAAIERIVRAECAAAGAPANHSPHFAPVVEPTLLTATRAQVVAALAHLGAEREAV